jgi:RNA polymerase-binding transcription factor DksA
MDSSVLASEEYEREMSSKLSTREQFKIGQIDDVLKRIAKLAFGVCETCGLEITEARLNAMPFTRLCCDCQQDYERKAKARVATGMKKTVSQVWLNQCERREHPRSTQRPGE